MNLKTFVYLLCVIMGLGITACDGSSCKNDCTIGTLSCQDDDLMTCGDFDGNGCTEWGDPFTCPDQCLVDQCVNSCSDTCQAGSRRCSGTNFQVCSDTNGDGCSEWGSPQACGPDQTCSGDGECTNACVDACTVGQTRCVTGQPQYQECTCPAEACCEWSAAIDCGAGESCSNGNCVGCADDCTPAGARQCVGNNAYQVCGNVDADPCNEWSAQTDCVQGQVCVNGACTAPCTDECQGTGARECTLDLSGFKTCGNYDVDPCLEWGDAKGCAPTEICGDGVCQYNCSDECAAGEKRCLGNGYQTCAEYDQDPCSDWSVVTDCKHNETCSNGVCSVTCQDECVAGALECSGFQSYRACGEFDHDPCTDWGEPESCALWERCVDAAGPAECALICFHDCDTPGEGLCAGDGYVTCGDHDWDACLEWSDVIECAVGELCSENPDTSQGECSSMPCADDCASEGARECYLDVGYRVCGLFDSDVCLDWSQVTQCGSGKLCQAGQCVDACTDACQQGEQGCVDSANRWVCNDADGDGCLDQIAIACAAGQTCDTGLCSVNCTDDQAEPNDDPDNSTAINSEGTQAGLVVCADNDDWFDVIVGSDMGLAVTLSFDHALGDLDMELYDFDDPTTAVANSAGVSDTESVVMPAQPGGAIYLIRVYGYAGAANQYDLTVDFVAAGECLDDYLEENDDQADARFVLDGSYEDLMICVGDEDWYENYMFVGEDLIVDLLFSHANGDLDLEIRDENGMPVALADSSDDDETATAAISTAGYYYVRVYSYSGQDQNNYDMAITYGAPCTDDQYEANNELDAATLLDAGTFQSLMLCPNDEDWYAFIVGPDSFFLAEITFIHADGDLDMYMYDEFGGQLDYSTTTTDDEIVGADTLPEGIYYLRVKGWQGAENDYDLEVLF